MQNVKTKDCGPKITEILKRVQYVVVDAKGRQMNTPCNTLEGAERVKAINERHNADRGPFAIKEKGKCSLLIES